MYSGKKGTAVVGRNGQVTFCREIRYLARASPQKGRASRQIDAGDFEGCFLMQYLISLSVFVGCLAVSILYLFWKNNYLTCLHP